MYQESPSMMSVENSVRLLNRNEEQQNENEHLKKEKNLIFYNYYNLSEECKQLRIENTKYAEVIERLAICTKDLKETLTGKEKKDVERII